MWSWVGVPSNRLLQTDSIFCTENALGSATTIVMGAAAILVFDTLGSLASRRFAFAYSRLAMGSFAIYLAVGFLSHSGGSVVPSVLAGAAIALIESTAGWAISWTIGPGRPARDMSISGILQTVALVTALGAMLGGVGGWIRALLFASGS
jgi:hypothetical protein